jgi:hypothetical protein
VPMPSGITRHDAAVSRYCEFGSQEYESLRAHQAIAAGIRGRRLLLQNNICVAEEGVGRA